MTTSGTPPKKILNKAEDAVAEFIEGLLIQYPNHLKQLEHHGNVVLAASVVTPTVDDDNNSNAAAAAEATKGQQKVHLLSGGGSGHEPSHAGWIGHGMLSCAVCGGIFASPSVQSIQAALFALASTTAEKKSTSTSKNNATDSHTNVLMIVKNYTGDRLNFGMAAEKTMADMSTISVETVIVADDCALPRVKIGTTGARGIAGTVFVHKIAGAAAAMGRSLSQVTALARLVARRVQTVGIALDAVTVPGAAMVNERLNDPNLMEIGLGIHGEAGLRQSPLLSADDMAYEMVRTIQQYGRVTVPGDADYKGSDDKPFIVTPSFQKGDTIVVLVNNLGGTSNFEMSIIARSCVKVLEERSDTGVICSRVYVGSYMTSFDTHGVSLTILNVSGYENDLLPLLDAPTTAPAWQPADIWNVVAGPRPSALRIPEDVNKMGTVSATEKYDMSTLPAIQLDGDFTVTASRMIEVAATALVEAEPVLTQYDTIVGDGDCGITLKRGAMEILSRLNAGQLLVVEHPVPLFAALGDAISASMGGTSGVLMELLMRKISSTLQRSSTPINTTALAHAFMAGVQALELYGGASVGSRTMMDALIPASTSLVATAGMDLGMAAAQAKAGAESTAAMKQASAGRSNYLSEETLQGTPDPGAMAVAIVLQALAD